MSNNYTVYLKLISSIFQLKNKIHTVIIKASNNLDNLKKRLMIYSANIKTYQKVAVINTVCYWQKKKNTIIHENNQELNRFMISYDNFFFFEKLILQSSRYRVVFLTNNGMSNWKSMWRKMKLDLTWFHRHNLIPGHIQMWKTTS